MKGVHGRLILALAITGVLAGCQTGSGGAGGDGQRVALTPFAPLSGHAPVQWIEGRYPNLLDPSSFAVWPETSAPVLETVPLDAQPVAEDTGSTASEALPTPAGEDAQGTETPPPPSLSPVSDAYLDIECRVASMFADTSIAYDVAGLRGVNIYLLLPDGTKLRPAQVRRGSALTEEPRGALRYFARTNHIVFPLRPDGLAVPADGGGEQRVRLVLEGYGAVYAFEWQARPTGVPPRESTLRGSAGAAREGMRDAFGTVKRIGHNFD